MDSAFRDELKEAEERAERRMREAMDALGQAESRTRFAASSPTAARTGLAGSSSSSSSTTTTTRDWRAAARPPTRPALFTSSRWSGTSAWADAAAPATDSAWAERVVPAQEPAWRGGEPERPRAAPPYGERAYGRSELTEPASVRTRTRLAYGRVVLISSRVEQRDQLLSAAADGAVVQTFDWSTNNLESLLAAARQAAAQIGGQGAARIALVTHGRPGTLGLVKGARVTAETLAQAEMQTFWRDMAKLVEIGGSIDLLGCRLACSEEGRHVISELERLTGLHICAVETGDADSSDCSTDPAAVDPGELYFERSRLAAWSVSAARHVEVHERKAAKRERREADKAAAEAEQQVSAAKRVLTRARKTAEARAQTEEEARLAAEHQCEQLREQLQAERSARVATEEQLQMSNAKKERDTESTQALETELVSVRRALEKESEARLALDRELEATKDYVQTETRSKSSAEKQVQELIATLATTEERLRTVSASYQTATVKIAELESSADGVAAKARLDALANQEQSVADAFRQQLADEYTDLQARTATAEASIDTYREQAHTDKVEAMTAAAAQREAEERMRKAEHEYSMAVMRTSHLENETTRLEAQLDAVGGTAEWRLLPEAQAQAYAARTAQQKRAQEQIDKAASFFAAKAIEAEQSAPNAILEEQLAAEAAARISAEDRTDAMIARAERAEEMVARAEVVRQQAIEEAVEAAEQATRNEVTSSHEAKIETVRATSDSQIWAVKADCEAQIRTIQSQSEAQIRAVVEAEAELRGIVEMQKQERERAVVIATDLQELNNQLREAAANAEIRASSDHGKLTEATEVLSSLKADLLIANAKLDTQETQHIIALGRAVTDAVEETTTRYRDQQGKAVQTAELLADTRADQKIQLAEMRLQNEALADTRKAQTEMDQSHAQVLDDMREKQKHETRMAVEEAEEKFAAQMKREKADIEEAAESRITIARLEAEARVAEQFQETLADAKADAERRVAEAESYSAMREGVKAADPKELTDLKEQNEKLKAELAEATEEVTYPVAARTAREAAEDEADERINQSEAQAKLQIDAAMKAADEKVKVLEEKLRDAERELKEKPSGPVETVEEAVAKAVEKERTQSMIKQQAHDLEVLTAQHKEVEDKFQTAQQKLDEASKTGVEDMLSREAKFREETAAEAEKFEAKLALAMKAKTTAEAGVAKAKKLAGEIKKKEKAERTRAKTAETELAEVKTKLQSAEAELVAMKDNVGKSKEEMEAAVAKAKDDAAAAAAEELEMMKAQHEVALLEREDMGAEESAADLAEKERQLADTQRLLEKKERKEGKAADKLAREKIRAAGAYEELAKEMEQNLLTVEKELETKEEEVETLRREIEELQGEVSAMNNDLESERATTQEAQSERDSVATELAAERQQLRQLQMKAAAGDSEDSAQSSLVADAERRAAEEKERRVALEEKLQMMELTGGGGDSGGGSGLDETKVREMEARMQKDADERKLLEAESTNLKTKIMQLETELRAAQLAATQAAPSPLAAADPAMEQQIMSLTLQIAEALRASEMQVKMTAAARQEADTRYDTAVAATKAAELKLQTHLAAGPAAGGSGGARTLATEMAFEGDFATFPEAESVGRLMFEEAFKVTIASRCGSQQVAPVDVNITGYRGGSIVVEFSIAVKAGVQNDVVHKSLEDARAAKIIVGIYAVKDAQVPAFIESADPGAGGGGAPSAAMAQELADAQQQKMESDMNLQAAQGKVQLLELQLAGKDDANKGALAHLTATHKMKMQGGEIKLATVQAEIGMVKEQLAQANATAALSAASRGGMGGSGDMQATAMLQAELGMVKEQLAQANAMAALQAANPGGMGASGNAQATAMLQMELNQVKEQLMAANTKVLTTTQQVAVLEAQGGGGGGDSPEMQGKIDELEAELTETKEELAEKEGELDSIQDDVMQGYEEQEELAEQISNLEEELETLKAEVEELKADLEEAQASGGGAPAEVEEEEEEEEEEEAPAEEVIEEEEEEEEEEEKKKKKNRKDKKKKKKGAIDNSEEEWSELEGWIKKDDKKRYCRLSQGTITLTKKDDEGSKPVLELELEFVTGVRADEETVQIEYDGEDVEFAVKDEEGQLWEECIMQNIELMSA